MEEGDEFYIVVLVFDESLFCVGIGDGMIFGVFKDFFVKVVFLC